MSATPESLLALTLALAMREEETMTLRERSKRWAANRAYWNAKIDAAFAEARARRKLEDANGR